MDIYCHNQSYVLIERTLNLMVEAEPETAEYIFKNINKICSSPLKGTFGYVSKCVHVDTAFIGVNYYEENPNVYWFELGAFLLRSAILSEAFQAGQYSMMFRRSELTEQAKERGNAFSLLLVQFVSSESHG
jgi:hypothetical protein